VSEVRPAREALDIDRRAPVRRVHLDASSWVDLVEGFVCRPEEELHDVVDNVPWQRSEVLRYDHYVPERRLVAGLRATDRPMLRQTQLHLESTYRRVFTGVAALQYRDGSDFQGLHSDREMRWLDDTLIAIVVLGCRRPFVFRPRAPVAEVTERVPAGSGPHDVVLMPGGGDLLVMGGACQRAWLHGVPAVDAAGPRVSLTWRWTSRRGRPDTAPTYYDGRQFGDSPRRPGSRTRSA